MGLSILYRDAFSNGNGNEERWGSKFSGGQIHGIRELFIRVSISYDGLG
jgi:hypothetical protein